MTDGRPDPREPLEFPYLNSVEEPRQLEAVVEKRFTMDPSGPIEIIGYEADDVVKILKCMAEQNTDAASWRAEG